MCLQNCGQAGLFSAAFVFWNKLYRVKKLNFTGCEGVFRAMGSRNQFLGVQSPNEGGTLLFYTISYYVKCSRLCLQCPSRATPLVPCMAASKLEVLLWQLPKRHEDMRMARDMASESKAHFCWDIALARPLLSVGMPL